MKERNRLRLGRITARHAKRAAEEADAVHIEPQKPDDKDAAYLAGFELVRDEVLRPIMAEVGIQLKAEGYLFRILTGGDATSPSIELHVIIAGRRDSKDTIRFFARKDVERGWQVIGEIELKRSPFELARFETTEEMTHDVVEQLIVDAVEQMFSSTGAPRTGGPPVEPPPSALLDFVSEPGPQAEDTRGHSSSRQGVDPARATHEETETTDKQADRVPEPGQRVSAAHPADEAPERAMLPLPLQIQDAPEMRWARWAGAQATMGTTTTVDAATLRRAVLPFTRGGAPQQSLAATDAIRREKPATPTGDETVVLPVKAQPAPSMSLEQYAALCAELAVFPAQAATIHARYGLADAGARMALEQVFARRFVGDPREQQRWRALVVHYSDWHRRQPAFTRQQDATMPLSRSVLLAARARGPLPFPPPVAPVIRERPSPVEDDEDQTVELPPERRGS